MTDSNTPNYKDTLNLPKTSFPMKANLPVNEPIAISDWKQKQIYEKILAKRAQSPSFVMPDGPPYANGHIHVGHVLNKVLKDIVIKYKSMAGFKAPFIPGWDCHGLPIELKVTKALGKKRQEMTDAQVRDLCRDEANKWIEIQKEQFVRLGILADWDHPYLTLQPEYEAAEIRVLAKIFENGVFFQGKKPVYWCPALQTALAAAEIEYQDHKSPSIYVKFFINDEGLLKKLGSPDKPTSLVIWTTTPWTLPANLGISLNADFDYGLYDTGSDYIVIAKDLAESVSEACDLSLTLKSTVKGDLFDHHHAEHPFIEGRNSLLMLGQHVTLEAGTGCVHTAPGHGLDDYMIGRKYDLPVLCPVDEAGRYTSEFAKYEGKKIWEGNELIVNDLRSSGHLLGYKEVVHSYPHNPRSKTPLIFRATPQWFIAMDGEYGLREKSLKATEEDIQFIPSWGQQRMRAMLTNGPDWCVSRQRIWGVPVPTFHCEKCDEPLLDSEVMERIATAMEKHEKGLEAYYSTDPSEFTSGKTCHCGSTTFRRSGDILDVWFDSGVCHTAVQKQREGLGYPADIYLEGSDQHRGWFQTSLNSAIAAYGTPPFKALITHGFVNDSKGHKMSKSKGNTIDPADVIKKSGAEILRLWVAYEDYGQDVSVSSEIFQRVSETYRRMRNTIRFMLGNLGDFDPKSQSVEYAQMTELDKWALHELNKVITNCQTAYETYDFYKIYHSLNTFFTVALSATYLDVLKDRLYTAKTDGLLRRSSQTALLLILDRLTRLMAPILSFLAEETYEHIPLPTKEESVFLTDFPKPHAEWTCPETQKKFETLLELRSEISKLLEELRQSKAIGSSLDAALSISAEGKELEVLNSYKEHLPEFFIVSKVILSSGERSIKVSKADGDKCVRCWHYSTELGQAPELPGICPKCVEALT
ncbi:MAG: isoleucine--tRNA ligase [Bdellovibrionales bacterium]|nr:isoleucine--tRNA ligase [Bdellovibrionales bacterium]